MGNFDKKLFEMAQAEAVDAPAGLMGRVRAALEGIPQRGGLLAGRTARAALCALASALALACTALAVWSVGGFDAVELRSGGDLDGGARDWYSVEGGEYRRIPVEELSDNVRKIAEDNPVADTTKYFIGSDWSAAQEYSGVTLPENEAIDKLEIGTSYLTVASNEYGPTCLTFWQGTPGLGVTMTADVYTDLMGDGSLAVKRGFPTGELSPEEYVSENGLSVLIVHLEPGGAASDAGGAVVNTERYMADFLLEGFRYHIKVEVDKDEIRNACKALETLHNILDGFVL